MPATAAQRIPMSWDEYVDYDLGDRRAEYIDGALVVIEASTRRPTRCSASRRPPNLAVEILSTKSAHDTVTKFGEYAAAGLPRYWIVDPDGPDLTAYELESNTYRETGRFGPDDVADLDVGPARVRFRPGDLLS